MKKTTSFVLLMFLLIQCSKEQSTDRKLNLHLEETLMLGTDSPEAPSHEIFRMAAHAETDENDWMYVVNSGEASVRVYNEHGDYQKSFGSEGAGPGEFNAIGATLIDSKNRFLIVDPSLSRVSAFTLDGDFIQAYELPSITRVQQLAELSDSRFALTGQYNEQMVHIVDANFSRIESSFVAVEDLLRSNEREERIVLQFYPGFVSILPDDSIVYTPALYGGELSVYSPDTQGKWNLTDTIRGHSPHRNPASFSAFQDAGRVDLPITFPDEGRYAVQFHSFSQGMYYVEEKGLYHFSVQETGDQDLELSIEKFSADLEFEGRAVIDTMDAFEITTLTMDSTGTIYLSDNRDFPKLRRLSATMK